ncbi:sensor histidine kinase [Rugosimonospora africana]|uniref:histidine kinase n=1 Tax=Rugosimonospora africana TaxID=556532 RepID=A0A8J3QP67_9ACTN|nr:histidine kinase [Rugosimonospora africana]GIH14026.1 hypothetical protein Raf01_21980 [Rugosimonospora africana]
MAEAITFGDRSGADRDRRVGRWRRGVLDCAIAAVVAGAACTVTWALTGQGYFWPRWVWFGTLLPVVLAAAVLGAARGPAGRRRRLAIHGAVTVVLIVMDVTIWLLSGLGWFWPILPALLYALVLGGHAWIVARLPPEREQELIRRVAVLTRTRSSAVDVHAAELRRIERDLHDGAQARIVSLAMGLGMAQRLVATDPAALAGVLAEARATALAALDDIRAVVHGIHPPVLADLGLAGAVEALALDMAVPVSVAADVPGRPPAPVESAAYFAVAECLANVGKHAGANRAWVDLKHRDGRLSVVVGDDGRGGARIGAGTGLSGVARRLETFDGTIRVSSPDSGRTTVTMEIPCALSSLKTTSSSGTA